MDERRRTTDVPRHFVHRLSSKKIVSSDSFGLGIKTSVHRIINTFFRLSEKGIGIFFNTYGGHGSVGWKDHGLIWQGKDMLTDMLDLAPGVF